VSLDPPTQSLLDLSFPPAAVTDPALFRKAAIFGRCWPDSTWESQLAPEIEIGETLTDLADRLGLPWNPLWLCEAGHTAVDSSGSHVSGVGPATSRGPISWRPAVRLPKVDDQIGDDYLRRTTAIPYRRRLAGEVALAALWRDAATTAGNTPVAVVTGLDGGARGARFRDCIVHSLSKKLGAGWTIGSERPLASVFGLHLRRDVGNRGTDVVVIHGDRLIALVSSKWSWRSDRGTEGAQIGRLRKYRPDMPYVSVTSEFVRARVVARESDEDQVYFLGPGVDRRLACRQPSGIQRFKPTDGLPHHQRSEDGGELGRFTSRAQGVRRSPRGSSRPDDLLSPRTRSKPPRVSPRRRDFVRRVASRLPTRSPEQVAGELRCRSASRPRSSIAPRETRIRRGSSGISPPRGW
jgi:hypothetical protein